MSELPGGWAATTLADICGSVDKHRPSDDPDSEFRYIDIGGIENQRIAAVKTLLGRDAPSRARQIVHRGDTALSTVRTYLRKTALIPDALDGATASTGFCVMRPREGIDPGFVFYRVTELGFVSRLSELQTGSSYPAVRDSDVLAQAIDLPPLAEQRRIVAVIEEHFSRLDAAEESLREAEARVRTLRVAIVNEAIATYPRTQLGDLTDSLRYGTSVKCLPDAHGPLVLRIPNIRDGRIDLTDLKSATVEAAELGDCFVEEGDLLFVRTNGSRDLIGRVAVVTGVNRPAFASYLIRARPDSSVLDPRWAALALSTPLLRAVIESRAATTAGQYNLNLQSLRSLEIPLPPLGEQRRIVAEVERQLSLVDALAAATAAALKRSAALRRSILERAFSGKLVPQDPSDEPASVLLDRIRAERANDAGRASRGKRKTT